MLRMMCEYFDLDIANTPRSRKATYMHLHFIINCMSLSLIPLSNVQIMIKEQQEIFQAYGFSMGGKGKGGYQSRITFNVELNPASLRTF